MTESQFKARLLVGEEGMFWDWELALKLAKEAGAKFDPEPEPVKLPRIEVPTFTHHPQASVGVVKNYPTDRSLIWPSPEQAAEIARRCNAWEDLVKDVNLIIGGEGVTTELLMREAHARISETLGLKP